MRLISAPLCAFALFSSLALTGCSMSTSAVPSALQGASIQGTVHGGQQAIAGAKIYLLAANTTSNANYASTNASVSLLTQEGTGNAPDAIGSFVVSGNDGSFTITGDYTCIQGQQVYVLALGGNPGGGVSNPSIGLMSTLGACPALVGGATTSNFNQSGGTNYVPTLWLNEVTTVATAYALAGYASDATHVFTSGSALSGTGVANAFANFNNLANIATGFANTATPGNSSSVVPQTRINTLANILASCINSQGVTGPNTAAQNCVTLFSNAKSAGTAGAAPTETATAAINIAHNPWANVATLYGLQSGVASPYHGLSAAPTDLAVGILFYGVSLPTSVAVDAGGNVWVNSLGSGSINEFSPAGVVLSPTGGYTGGGLSGARNLTIDSAGNIWTANFSNSKVSEFYGSTPPVGKTTGAPFAGSPFSDGNDGGQWGIAVDASGNIWTSNNNNASLSEFTSTGTAITTSTGYTGGGLDHPISIAFDVSGDVWLTNQHGNSISKFFGSTHPEGQTTGAPASSAITGGGLSSPTGIAINTASNVWVADSNTNKVSAFNLNGADLSSGSGFANGGLSGPSGIASDGSGHLWVSNISSGLSEFGSTGAVISPNLGFGGGQPEGYTNLAVDGSGNVWATGASNTVGTITEFIGAAIPIVTPTVANLLSPYAVNNSTINRP